MLTYEHLEGVETEFNSADRGRQVRLHVGAFTSRTDGLGVGDGLWKDAEIDTNLDFLLIFDRGQQERIVSVSKLKRSARWHLFA